MGYKPVELVHTHMLVPLHKRLRAHSRRQRAAGGRPRRPGQALRLRPRPLRRPRRPVRARVRGEECAHARFRVCGPQQVFLPSHTGPCTTGPALLLRPPRFTHPPSRPPPRPTLAGTSPRRWRAARPTWPRSSSSPGPSASRPTAGETLCRNALKFTPHLNGGQAQRLCTTAEAGWVLFNA